MYRLHITVFPFRKGHIVKFRVAYCLTSFCIIHVDRCWSCAVFRVSVYIIELQRSECGIVIGEKVVCLESY